MRKTIFLLGAIAFVLSLTTVYGEVPKVPGTTLVIDKAVIADNAKPASNGANIYRLSAPELFGYNVEILGLAKIHWVADETFYSTGYKALLSKEVTQIFVPPSNENVWS